jgi:hypothetical protein
MSTPVRRARYRSSTSIARQIEPRNRCPQVNARGERRDQARARSSVHSSASVARNDTPRIGDRATTRGRIATEGGDGHAGAKSALLGSINGQEVDVPLQNAARVS